MGKIRRETFPGYLTLKIFNNERNSDLARKDQLAISRGNFVYQSRT